MLPRLPQACRMLRGQDGFNPRATVPWVPHDRRLVNAQLRRIRLQLIEPHRLDRRCRSRARRVYALDGPQHGGVDDGGEVADRVDGYRAPCGESEELVRVWFGWAARGCFELLVQRWRQRTVVRLGRAGLVRAAGSKMASAHAVR